MIGFLWILPILTVIAIVLGTCRAECLPRILRESGLSFMRLTVGITIVCVALQALLFVIPRIF